MNQSLASISELVPAQARLLSRNAASDLCSEVRVVGVSIECLGIVNGVLDEILIRILEHSQSFRLALLRRATLDVIGVGFGQNAITEAEMKLKQQQSHRSYLSEQSSEKVENFPLNAAFNTLRHYAIIHSKYSERGAESLSLSATLEQRLQESLRIDVLELGNITTAAIYVSGVMECVSETICVSMAKVVVRSSVKMEATEYELYDAIQENDLLCSLVQNLGLSYQIEHKVRQAQDNKYSQQTAQSTQNKSKTRPPPIDTNSAIHRRSSSIGQRLWSGLHTPISASSTDKDSMSRRSSSYLRKMKYSSLDTPAASSESPSFNNFDSVLNTRDTLKLSLTPNTVDLENTSNTSNTQMDSVSVSNDHLSQLDEVDSLDEELGLAPRRTTNKQESLLDFLNSTPPWEKDTPQRSNHHSASANSLPSSVEDEQHQGSKPGLSDFSRDLIAFLNTEPPGGTPKPLNQKKSTNKFKSIFKAASGLSNKQSSANSGSGTGHSHNTSSGSILNTAASTNGLHSIGSVSSSRSGSNGFSNGLSVDRSGSGSYTTAPKSSSSTLRIDPLNHSTPSASSASSPPPKFIPPPILTNAYDADVREAAYSTQQPQGQGQVPDKLPPIQSPLPMSTSFTRSPSPQLSASPVSYVHIQQSPKLSQTQSRSPSHSPHALTQPIPSSSSAIADQYAAAVLRRTQSSQNNLNLSPPLPTLTRSSSPSASVEDGYSAPLPRSRSQSIRRADGKPSTPRKPVPALAEVIDGGVGASDREKEKEREREEEKEKRRGDSLYAAQQRKHDKHHTYQSNISNISSSEWSDKHNSMSTNGRYSTAVQTMSRPSTLASGGDAYVHKDRLVKMHKILQNAQTADECRLYLDTFLRANRIPTSVPSVMSSGSGSGSGSASSASMKPQSRSSGGVDDTTNAVAQQQQRDSQQSHVSHLSYISDSRDDSGHVAGIPMSISEDRKEEEEEHEEGAQDKEQMQQHNKDDEDVQDNESKQSSSQHTQAVEIDHASSQSSLPQLVQQDTSGSDIEVTYQETSQMQSPTEIGTPVGTPITPTAATPYPAIAQKSGRLNEHDDDFVTKWLMNDSQAHTGNGIQVEISDTA
ncbi:hypothetical protein E3P99_01434 [Wallemia hederae]|uniref:Uncharacterized protein n=1 Tax=Wallemia hederae TaxID=1540922 RepID=A0A4T0FUQ2_9BASI|nr:hypothetical protein E3P99_01434 [Wallemia hederae]